MKEMKQMPPPLLILHFRFVMVEVSRQGRHSWQVSVPQGREGARGTGITGGEQG